LIYPGGRVERFDTLKRAMAALGEAASASLRAGAHTPGAPLPPPRTRAIDTCRESDQGGKIYRAGVVEGRDVHGENFHLADHCLDERHIVEYWCKDGTLTEASFDCLDPRFASYHFTRCEDGACISSPGETTGAAGASEAGSRSAVDRQETASAMLSEAVAGHLPEIQGCYRRKAPRRRACERVRLLLEIGHGGRIRTARLLVQPRRPFRALARCVEQRARRWRLPDPGHQTTRAELAISLPCLRR
ncbi:MAG: hypothetical protein D6729_13670, partial [Deltaproteobacteria bacterium]